MGVVVGVVVVVTRIVANGVAQVVGTEAVTVDLKVVETRIAGTGVVDLGVVRTKVGVGDAGEV